MTLLEYVKNKMEIRHTQKDETIQEDIKAAALDLSVCGVSVYTDEDGEENPVIKDDRLIWNAIANYCMWHDNTHGKGDQYMRYYKDALICMGNCKEYAYVQRDSQANNGS